jgi:hypothetical protein
VSFAKNNRRRFEAGRSRFVLPPLVTSPIVRYVVYALLALGAAIYGLASHYGAKLPPMHRTVTPPPAPTYDADAGEMPVPEFVSPDGG